MTFLTLLLLAYFIGSIPWGYIIARLHGVDIRKVGSGSTGATNVSRSLGLWVAILVGSLDVLKGLIVTVLAIFSLNSHLEIAAVLFTVIFGHIYSIFLGGKGGKGVATTFGVLLILVGVKAMLIVSILWLVLLFAMRLMSVTNLALVLLLPLYFIFIHPDPAYFLFGMLVVALIYWSHRQNIERLKAGKELRLDIRVGYKRQKKEKKTTLKKPAKKRLLKKTAQ